MKKMKYIFELNHPKHYYQFKYVMHLLQKDGHNILVLARDKDVLLKVLQEEGVPYEIFGLHKKKMIEKILGSFSLLRCYSKIVKKYRPDVVVSKASLFGVLMAKKYKAKSVIFPDSEVVALTNKYVVPRCTKVVTPENFTLDYGNRHIRVKGVFEDCYLSPSVFHPDEKVISENSLKKPYVVFRFVGWYANHDVNNSGFTLEEKIKLVRIVEPHMTVYISSEKELPEELKEYKLPTPASAIHSVLAFADLYLGDSQTMATEAALLGTPAIRSNSFVGENDMSNFKMLENKYGLLRNIASFDEVLKTVQEFSETSRKSEWMQKKEAYYASVGDINKEIVTILENM